MGGRGSGVRMVDGRRGGGGWVGFLRFERGGLRRGGCGFGWERDDVLEAGF